MVLPKTSTPENAPLGGFTRVCRVAPDTRPYPAWVRIPWRVHPPRPLYGSIYDMPSEKDNVNMGFPVYSVYSPN